MFNDGTAFAIFLICVDALKQPSEEARSNFGCYGQHRRQGYRAMVNTAGKGITLKSLPTPQAVDALGCVGLFFRMAVGGVMLGLLVGWVMVKLIEQTQDGVHEVITTLVFSYGSFILAEQLHVSGVLAVVMVVSASL